MAATRAAGKCMWAVCRGERWNALKHRLHQGVNLCVKNLDEDLDDERLCEEFAPFGGVTHAAVVMEGSRSRGFRFVRFSSPEEAAMAVTAMNGRIVATKPLHVTLAQSKEERRAHLINQYLQRMATICAGINPYQPDSPSGYFTVALLRAQNSQQPASHRADCFNNQQ